jgi:hypothetical protein
MLDFEVVTLPPAAPTPVGEPAPDRTRPLVTAEFWEDVALAELNDAMAELESSTAIRQVIVPG